MSPQTSMLPVPAPARRAALRVARIARRVGKAFAGDTAGLAAVEFAMVTPVLVLMLVGAVEITRAVSIDRRVSVATNMIADLVARETKLTGDDVRAIYDVAERVMSPYDAAPLTLSIIPVMASANNASQTLVYPGTTNRPSYHGGNVPAKCQSYTLANGMLEANESVIVVEGNYTFTPLFTGYVMGSQDWSKTAVAKPRKSMCVAFDGDTCTTTCFAS
ncbi:MAG: TadE/TadG family type IV pilus assembly protein [Hyphomicrobium sp.]|uniref:TadE/TadG family type IV pilus assembly protein n=1 Tax=Hyphomicrobium sp. TaxID=82 RepID=UPI003D13E98A